MFEKKFDTLTAGKLYQINNLSVNQSLLYYSLDDPFESGHDARNGDNIFVIEKYKEKIRKFDFLIEYKVIVKGAVKIMLLNSIDHSYFKEI